MGDRIAITIELQTTLEYQAEQIPLQIIYEDKSLMILNKDAGIVVHPAAGSGLVRYLMVCSTGNLN